MLADHVLGNVVHTWLERLRADPRLEVVARCGEDLLSRGVTTGQLEHAALTIATAHRLTPWPMTGDALQEAVRHGHDAGTLLACHVAALRLTALGAYAPLPALARTGLALLPGDGLLTLLAAAGDLVCARATADAVRADEELRRALRVEVSPRRCRLALQAYAMATHLPDAAQRIVTVAGWVADAGGAVDAHVHHLAAVGLRHQLRFAEALNAIDTALAALAAGSIDPADAEAAAEQFLDERELIRMGAALHAAR